LTAIRMVAAQLAVLSGEASPTKPATSLQPADAALRTLYNPEPPTVFAEEPNNDINILGTVEKSTLPRFP